MIRELIITELPAYEPPARHKIQAVPYPPECFTGDETVLVLRALSEYVERRADTTPQHGVAQRLYGVVSHLRGRAEKRSAALSQTK